MQLYDDRYHHYEQAIQEPEKVTGIHIAGTNWSSKMPELLKFPNLSAIHIQARSIQWTPADLEILKQCKNLKEITIKPNIVNRDPIHRELAEITQLEKLVVSKLYERTIPHEIFDLPHLKTLELDEVKAETVAAMLTGLSRALGLESLTLTLQHQSVFTEGFLSGLSALKTLKSLRIKGSPAVPKEIMELPNLESLSIEGSPIPDWIWDLNQLRSLELTHNYLKTIPAQFADFKQLEHLSFRLNSLTEIPDCICDFTHLKTLNLGSNHFSQLPENIGNLQNLEVIELRRTLLEDLPASFSNLKSLKPEFVLSEARFSTFPEVLCGLTQLKTIDFSKHTLTELPDAILQLKNLEILDLRGCKIKEFPTILFQLKSLNSLVLTQNPITRGDGKVLKKYLDQTFFGAKNQALSVPQKQQMMVLLMEDEATVKQQIPLADLKVLAAHGSRFTQKKAKKCISEMAG